MRTASRRALAALAATVLASSSALAAAPAAYAADNTPPTITIDSPADGTVFGASGGWVTFTTADDVGVASWEVIRNGISLFTGTGAGQASVNLLVGDLANGSYSLTINAVDTSGNPASVTRSFGVSIAEPDVQLVSPVDGARVGAGLVTIGYQGVERMSWRVSVDGTVIRDEGGYSGTTFPYAPATPWADGSAHTVEVTGTDGAGRSRTVTANVTADAAAPVVTLDPPPPTTLPRATTLTGTVADAVSGIAWLRVMFAEYLDGACSSTEILGSPTVTGASWSLELPPTLVDGEYCVTVSAADEVGNVGMTTPVVVDLDVTGPDAPTGLSPDGESWDRPSALSWSSVADAVSYEYQIAEDPWQLDSADLVAASTTTAILPAPLDGIWFWRVRGIDAVGNPGDWSDVAEVSVLGAPQLDDACGCRIVGGSIDLEWGAVPDVVSYRIQVTGADAAGAPVVFEQDVDGAETDATVTLPPGFPTGTISVRLRAELDHEVAGSTLTGWSERLTFLRFGVPSAPTLLAPAAGAYVRGDGVAFSWRDDPSAVFWELRVSSDPTLGPDGGLVPDVVEVFPLLDPMLAALVLLGDATEIPDGIRLSDLDAALDCAVLRDVLQIDVDDPDFPCSDGAFVLPMSLDDGTHYWQVRGIGFDTLFAGADPGAWSSVGRFVVGAAPVTPPPAANGGHRGHGGSAGTGDADVVEPAPDGTGDGGAGEPAGGGSGGTASGGGAEAGGDTPDAEPVADDGLPIGWLLGGLGLLVLLAVAAGVIRFLVVRRR